MEKMITLKEQIRKFFFEKHLDFLTSVPQRRIQEMVLSSCVKGNTRKTTDCAEIFSAHRTTYGHFLSKGKWDEGKMEDTLQVETLQTVTQTAQSQKKPVFLSIDDTVITKTKPSSKARRPTEGTAWHCSHLEKRMVYGCQVHAALLTAGNVTQCYSLRRYDK